MSANSDDEPIKIVLIDPQPLIYQAVARQIEDCADLTLAAWGKTAAEALALAAAHSPRVMSLDFDLPPADANYHRNGDRAHFWSLIEQLRGEHPGIKLLLLAAHPDASLPGSLNRWGLHGVLLKDDPLTLRLPEVIRTIGSGGCCVSQAILENQASPAEAVSPPILTPRQVEVLATIVAQPRATYDGCAHDLGISRNTFDTHLSGIYDKLDAPSPAAALVISVQWGIISIQRKDVECSTRENLIVWRDAA